MITIKSKPDEILHYLEQVESLLMTEDESSKMVKILELKNLLADEDVKTLILEETDKDWIKDSLFMIDSCIRKIDKNKKNAYKLREIKNFYLFRVLEQTLNSGKYNTFLAKKENNTWSFYLSADKQYYSYLNNKFINFFTGSKLESYLNELNELDFEADIKKLLSIRRISYDESVIE